MNEPVPRRIETDRGTVEYAVVAGDGPPVLVLHGAMGGWDQSLLLARVIGEPRSTVVAVSRPGYLGTPLAAGRDPEDQADLYAELLDRLGVGRVGVMAISGGGPSAVFFATRHAERCAGLVLVSTCGTRVVGRLPMRFHVLRWLGRFRWFESWVRRQGQKDPERAARRSIRDPQLCARTLNDPAVGPLYRELLSSTSRQLARRLPGTVNDIRVTRRFELPLEQVSVPTLVVHGDDDRVVPFEAHGRALSRRIAGAELLVAEGGDHVAIFTHRGVIQPRVAHFLRQHAAPVRRDDASGPAVASATRAVERS
jgi:pimeloyl-ACP methyl ester carboxylesterase